MDLNAPVTLLGGISPTQFMRRHWGKKPLLVRQAWPAIAPPLTRAAMFEMAGRDDVESRLVQRRDDAWRVRQGPVARRLLPPVSRPGWTLLVQGLDLHVPAAHAMLAPFRFIPEARFDDLMISWASAGGGVGPHIDDYDVFLLQVQGRRRWRVGPPPRGAGPALVEGAPLKLLRHFEPTLDWVLEPGDMLYLPPRWSHDGTGEGGDCMTCSVGFRVPGTRDLGRELLLRLADEDEDSASTLYRDPSQPATATPGELPPALAAFARAALARRLADPLALTRALGEILTEPKPTVWFETHDGGSDGRCGLRLDARTRMLYDARHVFINGESYLAGGRDARLLRTLADTRELSARERRGLSAGAFEWLAEWCAAGWLREIVP